MKTCYPILAVVAAATLWFNISSASAQDAARGRRGGAGMANMTEDQRAALQQVREETRDQNQKVAAARTELNSAIYAEKVDEAAIKAKAAAVAKAEEEFSVAYAKAFAKVRSKFGSAEIDTLKQMGTRGGGGAGGARRRGAQ